MTTLYKPTVATKEILDQLDPQKEYCILYPNEEPQAMVTKAWLERRPGCYKILMPHKRTTITDHKIHDLYTIIHGGKYGLWNQAALNKIKKWLSSLGAKTSPILIFENDLPDDMTATEYSAWFDKSEIVHGVRMGPEFEK